MALGSKFVPPRLLIAGVVASILPDLDVLAFRFGIDYSHEFGHRGASHSVAFALLPALLAFALAARLRASRGVALLFVFAAAISHGLLDMLTNGGLGVALLWPRTDARFFFPVRVIEASPLNLERFFGPAGIRVITSELVWIWLPLALASMASYFARRKSAL